MNFLKPKKITQAEQFGRVAVVMGGVSAEKEISIKSGNAVLDALKRQNVDVVGIDIGEDPIAALAGEKIDRVFNIIHGRGGEDGVLQAVLEVMQLPYTGAGVMSSALTMDKLRTKLCWQGSGLVTPKWFVLKNENDVDSCINYLNFPVIVKPAQEGSSIGMSKANTRDELKQAIEIASAYQCDVYAEAWVEGKEYTIGVIGEQTLPVIRLETPNAFYDYEAKYQSNTTRYHCPCGLAVNQEKQLQDLALKACDVVGIKGWGRVDVFLDNAGNSQLIEVNTVPGMTDHSLVPMAAEAAGIEFDELVWRILETSFND